MFKLVIVTDSDRASGFRLAGAEVYEADGMEEAKATIPPLLHKDDIFPFALLLKKESSLSPLRSLGPG